jgi:hypothetical protein
MAPKIPPRIEAAPRENLNPSDRLFRSLPECDPHRATPAIEKVAGTHRCASFLGAAIEKGARKAARVTSARQPAHEPPQS